MRSPVLTLGLLIAALGGLSIWLGPDASWDFRNYHLYNAHAALAGTLWSDIAPAQLQSFYNPALDIPPYLLRRALNAHPAALDFLLAVPHAIAIWLVLGIASELVITSHFDADSFLSCPRKRAPTVQRVDSRFRGNDESGAIAWLPGTTAARCELAIGCVLFGATGAAALPTLGTGLSDMPATCLILMSLLRCIRGSGGMGAGVLAGAAAGLKLTNLPFALGLCVAVLISRARTAPVFLGAAVVGLLLAAGPWCWLMWSHTGNPIFPYFNEVFRSAWASPAPLTDTRFLPHGVWQTLFFPAEWAFRRSTASAEFPVRDPRLLLGLIACVWLALRAALRRDPAEAPILVLTIFWLSAFAAWEMRFGILRYAATLEVLSGLPVALVLLDAFPRRWVPAAFAGITAVVMAVTVYPDWGRAQPARPAADVRPPFQAGSLVLLLDPAPMAYVAAFSPPGVRFAGINNNLVRPGDDTVLGRAAAAVIAGQAGLLWGLESPADQPGQADVALRLYGLEREGPCVAVASNLDRNALRACTLRRISPRPANAASASPTHPGQG